MTKLTGISMKQVQQDGNRRGFSDRLNTACDTNPHCPDINYGRLTWVKRELETRFKQKISVETARKWFSGESAPRPDKMAMLATLLEVDLAWLSLGMAGDLTPRDRKARNAEADGAVNLVAGLIQMDGGHPAFPEADNKAARRQNIDLYAIIRGANYSIHVALAKHMTDGSLRFSVPPNHEDLLVVGVVRRRGFDVDLIELDTPNVSRVGVPKGPHVEVAMQAEGDGFVSDGVHWNLIQGFDRRI